MQQVEVHINGIAVDIDKNKIPLQFMRAIDSWEDFLGSKGTQAKSLADTLYIPATKKNAEILSNFDIYDFDSKVTQNLLDINVYVNGQLVFAGYGHRISIGKQAIIRNAFAIKILGDSTDVFSVIEGLSLRDLPMGDANTDHTDIEASWTSIADTNNPLVFAPLYYGGVGNGITVVTSGFQYATGLRPSVRIWRILEAIFEKQLGYKIDSQIYHTQMFRNLVYPFGVGDAWKRTDDISLYQCFVGTSGQLTLSPPAATVKFDDETGQYSDPQNMNVLSSIFRPTVGGWYVFEFNILGAGIDRVVLRGRKTPPVVVNINLGEFKPNVLNVTDPILFEPSMGLTEMIFTVERSASTGSMSVEVGTFYKAQLTDRFSYGAPLSIASCLHDKPQKDFIRGLQHLFGLVVAVDNVNKLVRIDPRFVNTTQPTTIPEGPTNQRDGYYDVEGTAKNLKLDTATTLSHKRPFGDSLTIGFAEDTGDGLYTYLKQKSTDQYTIPIYGAKIDFIPADKTGTTFLNPFFAPLLTVRFYSGPSVPRQARWGCIVDSFDDDLLTSGLIGETDAQYECAIPKIAMYYGVLDFNFILYEWIYAASPSSGTIGGNNKYAIPTVLGVFPNEENYLNLLSGVPFNITYTDINYGPPLNITSMGLINRYYQKYLAIIHNDKWVDASSVVDLTEYRDDFFAGPKIVNIGGQPSKAWQVKTNTFNPITTKVTDIELVLDYDNINGASYTITQQEDNPLLTSGYILLLSNTGQ